jgi:hypothetical protein
MGVGLCTSDASFNFVFEGGLLIFAWNRTKSRVALLSLWVCRWNEAALANWDRLWDFQLRLSNDDSARRQVQWVDITGEYTIAAWIRMGMPELTVWKHAAPR